MKVFDAACGIGYGSHLLAKSVPDLSITAIDIKTHAVIYSNEFYANPAITYKEKNILSCDFQEEFDTIISFETLEHIADAEQVISIFHKALKKAGTLFVSTPNQVRVPFPLKTHPCHVRHYTPDEFTILLEKMVSL